MFGSPCAARRAAERALYTPLNRRLETASVDSTGISCFTDDIPPNLKLLEEASSSSDQTRVIIGASQSHCEVLPRTFGENTFCFAREHIVQEEKLSIARGEDVGSSRVIFRGRRGYAWGSIGEAAETLRASHAHGSCPLPALWCTKVQLGLYKFGLASFELRLPLRADDVV